MRNNARFYVPVLTFLTLIGAIALVVFIAHQNGWPLCAGDDCSVQSWLSATSGWAGVVAAVVGAYFVYHQLSEQRRQTAFLLGDGEPVFQVHQYAIDNERAVFRFINWNRRTLIFRRLRIQSAFTAMPKPISVQWSDKAFKKGKATECCRVDAKGWLDIYPGAEGWHDRQGRPDILDFKIFFSEGTEDFKDILYGVGIEAFVEVLVDVQLDGSENELMLRVKVPIIDFLPNTGERFPVGGQA